MTAYRGFASMPSPLLWFMAAFFVIAGLYEVINGMYREALEDVLLYIGQLPAGLFLLYCVVQAWRGRRGELASPRTTMVGYACFGLFCLCFVVKVGATAVRIF
ncbi:hypothetical protein [Massilia sp. BSC265]|uniref:hypothetical protein n=1 Tax=Massilia sp. BSC265 TaxID=1549812 RepID=UPI0004E8C8BE|nr:hypothetical protein [Massilia sp. BSC265]KFI05341.1 hypothetical protein JN27_23130 [Massilia sp. BSC265]